MPHIARGLLVFKNCSQSQVVSILRAKGAFSCDETCTVSLPLGQTGFNDLAIGQSINEVLRIDKWLRQLIQHLLNVHIPKRKKNILNNVTQTADGGGPSTVGRW